MWIETAQGRIFASTGGRTPDAALPLVIFLHGAGMDHSVWSLQTRWFAHHGWRVLALDLPGHGASGGPRLTSIGAFADFMAGLIEAQGGRAAIIGHSMGSLIALETAARRPDLVSAIGLVASAGKMPVSPELLNAAKAGEAAAVDMVSLWSLGPPATRGGNPTPGMWMLGGAQRLLDTAPEGALHDDLAACNAYTEGAASAAKIACPALLVLGERDMMTPAKAGLALAAQIAGAKCIVIPGAGHMMMVERPSETLAALRGLNR